MAKAPNSTSKKKNESQNESFCEWNGKVILVAKKLN
jgi:hypothetical protein